MDDAGRLLQLAARARRHAAAGRRRRADPPRARWTERGLAQPRPLASVEELTSRKGSTDIPEMLDRLEAAFDPAIEAKRRRRARAAVKDMPQPARRAAGDEHDLGRRGRAAAGADGRRRPAQDDRRVHPGHQPRRPRASPGLVCHGLQLGAARATCRTTRRSSTTTPPSTSTSRRCRSRPFAAGRARPGPDRRCSSRCVRLPGTELQRERGGRRGSTAHDPYVTGARSTRSRQRAELVGRRRRGRAAGRATELDDAAGPVATPRRSAGGSVGSATEERDGQRRPSGCCDEPGLERVGRVHLPELAAGRRADRRPDPATTARPGRRDRSRRRAPRHRADEEAAR